MRVLADTSALLALANPRDQYHARAVRAARGHEATGGRYVSHMAVLAEFHAHLLYVRGATLARDAIQHLLADPAHEWLAVSPEVVHNALTGWLGKYPDQRFSLTDGISFEVMRRARVTHAFAFDHHFEIAGFTLIG